MVRASVLNCSAVSRSLAAISAAPSGDTRPSARAPESIRYRRQALPAQMHPPVLGRSYAR